jgi:signal transduction histidine kinase
MENSSITPAQKWALLAFLVAGITLLHYGTEQSSYYFRVFYSELYYLPIILAAFWFGLRGALSASITISVFYLPFILWHWQDFSTEDLDSILSISLYNGLALLTGALKDRETASRKMLLEAGSLAVMGRSLAAVAHDMRSPLMLIGGFARRILKKMDEKDPACLKLNLIIRETEKMERMTGDMLDFSKPLNLTLIRGNIGTIIQNSLAKVRELSKKKNVSVKYHPNPEAPDIKFDTMRFEQVIVNLVQNAIEASPEGGGISITISFSSPKNLILDIADNGCGIPLAKRHQVFDPFFTTKKEGTGLGLPIVKKILDAHGWPLEILDNGSSGTLFRINLTEDNTSDQIHK